MKTHILLTILIILIIVIYLIYLTLYKNKNIEGFEGISDYIEPSKNIETLITTQAGKNFEHQLWNNQTVLDSLPTEEGINLPVNINECKAINSRDILTQCPISIWSLPSNDFGYNHVGHILTRSFVKPNIEKIVDYRQPKTPAGSIEKNLDTMLVAGANLKDPEDYLYVGSFGSGDFSYDELSDATYKKKIGNAQIYLKNFIQNVNAKIDMVNSNINISNQNMATKLAIYANRFLPFVNIDSEDQSTITNLNEIISSVDSSKQNTINILQKLKNNFTNPVNTTSIKLKIEKINYNIINPYLTTKILKSYPGKIRDDVAKGIKISQTPSATGFYYIITFSNLEGISGNPQIAPRALGDTTISTAIDNENSQFTSIEKVQISVKYSKIYWVYRFDWSDLTIWRRRIVKQDEAIDAKITEPVVIGNDDGTVGNNQRFFYIQNLRVAEEDISRMRHTIYNFTIKPSFNYIQVINNDLLDGTNQGFYNNFNDTMNQIKTSFPLAFETTYRTLTIWQPIPPRDYVALGFIFTNKGKDIKPTNTGLKCVPKQCVKSFNRRLWRKEDLVFIYKDETQHLHFYRNPFLNTVVVIDQNKQNGYYAGKTPEILKYRTENDSGGWECFDIVPCVKTCDYVKRLEDSLVASKDTCKAHRSFENKFFEKDETKQSVIDEENKLKKLVSDRKSYIDNLMEKLNKMMSEEELYKVIDKGLNRYKLKTDLENQRELHGAAADKLMRTRGFEVNWTNPQDLSRFKNALQAILKGRFQNGQQQARDCPVCKLPDNPNLVKIQDLELCYGCLEDAVRELVDQKKTAGEPIPAELQEIADNIGV